jgi:hypothetical protein
VAVEAISVPADSLTVKKLLQLGSPHGPTGLIENEHGTIIDTQANAPSAAMDGATMMAAAAVRRTVSSVLSGHLPIF